MSFVETAGRRSAGAFSMAVMGAAEMWRGLVLCKFAKHPLGFVEGLFVTIRWSIAPGAFLGSLGVFQSRSCVALSKSHLG